MSLIKNVESLESNKDSKCYTTANRLEDFMFGTPLNNTTREQKITTFAQGHLEKNDVFTNENGFLNEQSSLIGGDLASNTRSAVYLDLENNGDLDIVINKYHDKAIVLKNNLSSSQNRIKVKLEGDPSQNENRDAIGSVISFKINQLAYKYSEN